MGRLGGFADLGCDFVILADPVPVIGTLTGGWSILNGLICVSGSCSWLPAGAVGLTGPCVPPL